MSLYTNRTATERRKVQYYFPLFGLTVVTFWNKEKLKENFCMIYFAIKY
jgi:hypothetical protein